MIVIKLEGGLGNQMFQYAAARQLAILRGTKLAMDLSWYDTDFSQGGTAREYELGDFRIQEKFYKRRLYTKIKRRLMGKRYFEHVYTPFQPQVLEMPAESFLKGLFQSFHYFENIRGVLLDEFTMRTPPRGRNAELARQIRAMPDAISLHIRRGDYVSMKSATEFHGLVGVPYYEQAVAQITKGLKQPHLFIFSDDPDWCRANLKFKQPTTFVSHNDKGIEDLRLMSLCRHNIIANSTFSWWAAWLNRHADKRVVAPKQWFSDPNLDVSGLLPPEWTRL